MLARLFFAAPPMQQLVLDVRPPSAPDLARFVTGRNVELRRQLDAMRDGTASERAVYLWGEPGCGKSYLLAAWAWACGEQGMKVGTMADADAAVVDDVQKLDAVRQVEIFDLYNHVRERGGLWLAAGDRPPSDLPLLPDLRTRLGWGLVYQVLPLADSGKRAALIDYAAGCGIALDPMIADYLLTHTSRELQRLLATVDELDRLSLSTRRPITLPLLKTLLAQG
jgi:DnaA family protein